MPAKLFASVQLTTKTEPTPNDLLVLDKTRNQRNAGSVKGTRRQQFNMCTNYKFSLAKIDRKCKGILDLRLSQCHSPVSPLPFLGLPVDQHARTSLHEFS